MKIRIPLSRWNALQLACRDQRALPIKIDGLFDGHVAVTAYAVSGFGADFKCTAEVELVHEVDQEAAR